MLLELISIYSVERNSRAFDVTVQRHDPKRGDCTFLSFPKHLVSPSNLVLLKCFYRFPAGLMVRKQKVKLHHSLQVITFKDDFYADFLDINVIAVLAPGVSMECREMTGTAKFVYQ